MTGCWWIRNTPFILPGNACSHPAATPSPWICSTSAWGSGYTHWNPGEHLEQLTGRTFDWEAVNGRRQEEIVRDLEHAGLLPGACELIRSLAEAGTPMGVASSSSHRWVDGWLNRLDIMPYFQTVICRDDGLPVKPDPALFLKAAETWACSRLNAWCWKIPRTAPPPHTAQECPSSPSRTG